MHRWIGEVSNRDRDRSHSAAGRQIPDRQRSARSLRSLSRRVLHVVGDLPAEYTVYEVHHLESRDGVRPRRDL